LSSFGGIDSLVVKFSNGKGYICAFSPIGRELCFANRFPLNDDSSFVNLGNNVFEFIITQQDFDNALELPE
jgi:hypothetical protein